MAWLMVLDNASQGPPIDSFKFLETMEEGLSHLAGDERESCDESGIVPDLPSAFHTASRARRRAGLRRMAVTGDSPEKHRVGIIT